jgi:hypothetical protein
MNFVNICAVLNPVLLIVILALMVVRKFDIKTFDYILLWLIAFLNVAANSLEVLFK